MIPPTAQFNKRKNINSLTMVGFFFFLIFLTGSEFNKSIRNGVRQTPQTTYSFHWSLGREWFRDDRPWHSAPYLVPGVSGGAEDGAEKTCRESPPIIVHSVLLSKEHELSVRGPRKCAQWVTLSAPISFPGHQGIWPNALEEHFCSTVGKSS